MKRVLIALAAFAVPLLARGQTAEYVAPPRTVEDILAVLDQYKPDPEQGEKRRQAANREPPTTDDRAALAQFYLERSRAHGALGQVSKRIEDLRRAAEYAKGSMQGKDGSGRQMGDEARILQELSLAESGGGNFLNAVRAREELLRNMQSQSQPRGGLVLSGFVGLAIMNAGLGDLEAARGHLSRAETVHGRLRQAPLWPQLGDQWSAALERGRGVLHAVEGKYAAAEAALRKAVQFMDKGRENNLKMYRAGQSVLPPGTYLALRNGDEMRLAHAMAQQGRLAEAEAATRNALVKNLSFFGRDHPASAGSLFALSRIIFEQGRFREAALLAAVSIETLERAGVAPEALSLANARRAYGTALVAQEKWGDAVAVFERMQEGLARDPLILRQFGSGDLNWGYALVKTGQPARAATMLGGLLETLGKRLGEEDRSVAELRGYLAIAHAASGERERALAEFKRAVPLLIEGARADEASETGGTARWMRLSNVLEAYIELLGELWQSKTPTPGFDAAAEAFRVADVARGSTVQRALSASAARGAVRDPQLAEIARQEQDAQHRIGVLSDLLSRLLAAPPEQQLTKIIGDVRRDLVALRATRTQLRREIERRFPDYAELTDPKPVSLTQAQAALRPGEALIAIYVGPAKTYVWAVSSRGTPAFGIAQLGRKQMVESVGKLRESLDVGDVALARMPGFDFKAGYALYAELLKPVEAGWKEAKSLLIAPHGALGLLPFAVLPTEPYQLKPDGALQFAANRDAPWLVKQVAVTQLPSVSTLATLRRAAQPNPGRREFIGFGDPIFGKSQVATAGSATRGVRLRNLGIAKAQTVAALETDPDAEAPPKPPGPAVSNSSGLAQLAPLPDTSEEIMRIAEVLRADPREDVYLRERATESMVKKLDLSKRKIVAFATHGLVPGDLNGLTQPALALSAPEVAGGDDDGLLTMEEIIGLKLDADWVVLSACNTGAGDGAGSEAVSGLGRAFFFAGARALLVSNWPVETASARLLTTGLFRRQVQSPELSRAEALRQTMLDLMNGRDGDGPGFSYAHPMFWAPFSLVGDGAGR